ncbi:membrane protein insertion efficiency factor YidD [Spirosoma foliorum]|uniref:Membrane protein insertion efficiency factor YidD n=1 Tax=Spirosoma foliorum TaxID=2710596 RepID=A0A7G5GUF9_9BACT|nr:membrane protein insertion efficiency factor YidD [Spirosoma foliorum]QMW02501.1 membrane protein insertion efficiency factor YidD [Spirosoma foliorum]
MKEVSRTVKVNGIEAHLNLDPALQATVLRALTGTTPLDIEVDALSLPIKPYWLKLCIRLLKWYRLKLSPKLGQRCVYEPSCSRYSELAFRKHGFLKGVAFTTKRLHRCRPSNGGIDLP